MKYAEAYEIFASQMLWADFISLSALAENFIIRKDYFILRSNISFSTSSEVAFFIFSGTLLRIVPTPQPRHRIIREVVYVNPCELTASVTAVANALACKYSNDELTLLASVLVQLGDTLVTIATQRAICENMCENINKKD